MSSAANPIKLRQGYRQRAIRYLETWRHRGWVVKVYGVAYRGESPRPDVVAAAKRRAHEALPQPATTAERYGIGFLVVHDGQDFCWALLDWWVDQGNPTFPFGAHVAVVEVDPETGRVELLRHIAVDDCGTVLNPLIVEGQQHGGIASGVGQALYEEVRFDSDGNPITSNFARLRRLSANA